MLLPACLLTRDSDKPAFAGTHFQRVPNEASAHVEFVWLDVGSPNCMQAETDDGLLSQAAAAETVEVFRKLRAA